MQRACYARAVNQLLPQDSYGKELTLPGSSHSYFYNFDGFFSSESYDTQFLSISNNAKYRLTHAGHVH